MKDEQRLNVNKYINLSTVFSSEVPVLYWVFSLCYFTLLLNYISKANIVRYTPIHVFDKLSYFVDLDYKYKI